jgi:hypothetical protein
MLAIGANEQGDFLGREIECPNCGGRHAVEHGKELNKETGEYEESTLLQFYKCGDKSYLCGIKHRSVMHRTKER